MIVDNPEAYYVFLFSQETLQSNDPGAYIKYKGKRLANKEFLEHWGKWVIPGDAEQMKRLAIALDPYTEQGIIPCCKYNRSPDKEFGMTECVFCVYCDDREKEEVRQIISSLGATPRGWSPERDVINKWRPGGIYLERWIEAKGYEGEMAEAIREDARRMMEERYGGEDAIATGWEQWGNLEY
ncbi:MAG: hypothetical protein IBX36_03865 [Dehalococcoidia bacterium]|nr:hypothetical protein [Dehalococcoidia bacterium]